MARRRIPKSPPSRGHRLFASFLAARRVPDTFLANMLDVDKSTVGEWRRWVATPDARHRRAIAKWTADAIPFDAWETSEERKVLEAAAGIPHVTRSTREPLLTFGL